MSVWQVVLHNLWGFDLVIVLVALGNALCFAATRRQANELYRRLHRLIFVPSRREHPELLAREISAVDEEEIIALRHRSESLYAVYVNVTAIFPLLGILGTVLSLLPMVADLSNMQMNFFAALTSTLWGLIFAIVLKVLDNIGPGKTVYTITDDLEEYERRYKDAVDTARFEEGF